MNAIVMTLMRFLMDDLNCTYFTVNYFDTGLFLSDVISRDFDYLISLTE